MTATSHASRRPLLRLRISLMTAALVAATASAIAPSADATTTSTAGNFLYVPSIANNTLTTINTDTNKVVRVQPYGRNPFVSVTNASHSKIITVNLFDRSFEIRNNLTGASHRVALPANAYIAVVMNDGRHIVATMGNNTLIIFDSVTERIIKTFKIYAPLPSLLDDALAPPPGAISLMLSPDNTTAYVGYGVGEINAYRLSDGRQVRPLISSEGTYPAWFNVSLDGRMLFAENIFGKVTVVNTASWRVITQIAAPIVMTGTVAPDGKHIFFAGLGGITVVDLKTLKIVATIPADGFSTNVLFNKAGTRAYFAASNNHVLPYLDLFSLIGLGRISDLGQNGIVQEFNPITYKKIGNPITVHGGIPGFIVGSPAWN